MHLIIERLSGFTKRLIAASQLCPGAGLEIVWPSKEVSAGLINNNYYLGYIGGENDLVDESSA